jgi:FkbM family methyltransferase
LVELDPDTTHRAETSAEVENMSAYTWRGILDEMRFRVRLKWAQRTFRPRVIKKTVEGMTFDFYVADAESAIWNDTGTGATPWKEMKFITERLVSTGDLVFDCGAHHGLTTLAFSEMVGETGRVVAFEPHPANIDIIRKNMALNHRTNVVVEGYALGSARGTVCLRDKSNASIAWRPKTEGISVEMVSLDQYAAQRGIHPTFVKVDVEGYEAEVLRGATSILRTCPKLAIEVHAPALSRYGGSVAAVMKLLMDRPYDLWLLCGETVQRFHPPQRFPTEPRFHVFAMAGGCHNSASSYVEP